MEGGVRLAGDPPLGLPDAPGAVHRVELPEVPPPGHRHPPGREAPGRLPADRPVRLHRLPHDRRRGLVRPRPDRRAARSARTSATSRPRSRKDWVVKWIKNPHAFRPDSRMPRFYGVTNNDGPEDQPKNHAEIQAITHYLFAKSTPPADFVDPPAKTDPKRGKELFLQKGCLACHQHRPYDAGRASSRPTATTLNPDYKPDPRADLRPDDVPRGGPRVRQGRLRPEPRATSPPSSSRSPTRATSG